MSTFPRAGAGSVVQGDEAADKHPAAGGEAPRLSSLRLMSYNIQTGIETRYFGHYLTRGWRHVLPHPTRLSNLDRISQLISGFDVVGLQEVDAGSFRSGYINQVEYLATHAQFPCWYSQTNRNLGKVAQHSNGILSRFRPFAVNEYKLPGMIPGRGALAMRFGAPEASLDVVIVHLALGQRTRMRQLDFVAELLQDFQHPVVMGDFNCRSMSLEIDRLCTRGDLCEPLHHLHTFPSWRPQHNIDHILVAPTLKVEKAEVLDHPLSDHLPIVMQVGLLRT
ncbi:endonuclease/exonuclease/phosphatase family protein [Alkalilimnicola ehrlichii]|uniref:endonuclease/exonuclease/phosphatase family protein n=1 Tax=Alkalilimnicola ehrlichii TaxID=351052 RepID=UPI0021618EB1|nr:endonuclease/exonuclease/phosphatase family protein [Alkalilimnicola ehrlichii]